MGECAAQLQLCYPSAVVKSSSGSAVAEHMRKFVRKMEEAIVTRIGKFQKWEVLRTREPRSVTDLSTRAIHAGETSSGERTASHLSDHFCLLLICGYFCLNFFGERPVLRLK